MSKDSQTHLRELLARARVETTSIIEKPPVFLKVVESDGTEVDIGHQGEFSLIIGKAKAKKTFYLSTIVAASLISGKMLNKIEAVNTKLQEGILYFDTEQSKYYFKKVIERIEKLSGYVNPLKPLPKSFRAYSLRPYTTKERLDVIEFAINEYNKENNLSGLRFVVIDGARDLVTSINDEFQATEIATKLLSWTEKFRIHIIVVLHQNKGNGFARGHLGSELVNKAETVYTIEKETESSEVSVVSFTETRGKTPSPFAFQINEDGLPEILDDWKSNSTSAKTVKISSWLDEQGRTFYQSLADRIFNAGIDKIKYANLVQNIKKEIKTHYNNAIGDNKAKEILSRLKDEKIIHQPNGQEYELNKLPF